MLQRPAHFLYWWFGLAYAWVLAFCLIVFFSFSTNALELKVKDNYFTVNGSKTFLYGVSYFDAVNWKKSDLEWIKDHGFNLIRIWLDWGITGNDGGGSFFNTDGSWSSTCPSQYVGGTRDCATHLTDLIKYADSLGIVVDVTINSYRTNFNATQAVRSTSRQLNPFGNVLIDLANEHSVHARISHQDGRNWVMEYRRAGGQHPITMSSAGDHIVKKDGSLNLNNLIEEVAMGINVLAPHFLRDNGWQDKVYSRSQTVMKRIGIPLYLQEEHRDGWVTGQGTVPVKDYRELVIAARNAKRAGAAGYVFHTDAGFRMGPRDRSNQICFKDGLSDLEMKAINTLQGEM